MAGSSSGDCEQAAEQVRIDILDDHLLHSLKLLDDALMSEEPDQQQPTRPCIQRVSSNLVLKKYYEPMVLAIGPIHKNKLPYGEKVKLKLAAQFIRANDIPKETALLEILHELHALLNCYKEDCLEYSDDLAFMFLVDGCALLEFMVSFVRYQKELLLQHVNYDFISLAKRDIILLENQLPYRLLQLLISFIPRENGGFINQQRSEHGDEFVIRIFIYRVVPPLLLCSLNPQKDQHPLHLLDLLHQKLTSDPPSRSGLKARSSPRREMGYREGTVRTVRELKSAGIRFNQSRTRSVKHVTFQQKLLSGTLSLPYIEVNDSTISMFMNLVAYEMCPDFKSKYEVTSYICFLSALIDHGDDVWLLRQAHILINNLGSDEDVAKLFKLMAIGLVPNPDTYLITKFEMYRQHEITGIIRTWLAEIKEKYFSNPWTFLAVCGAVFGLVLGFIQTWFAVKSYYHPQKP